MSFHVEKVEKVEKVEEQTRDLSQTDQQDSCYSAAADQTLSPSDSRAYNNKEREKRNVSSLAPVNIKISKFNFFAKFPFPYISSSSYELCLQILSTKKK